MKKISFIFVTYYIAIRYKKNNLSDFTWQMLKHCGILLYRKTEKYKVHWEKGNVSKPKWGGNQTERLKIWRADKRRQKANPRKSLMKRGQQVSDADGGNPSDRQSCMKNPNQRWPCRIRDAHVCALENGGRLWRRKDTAPGSSLKGWWLFSIPERKRSADSCEI